MTLHGNSSLTAVLAPNSPACHRGCLHANLVLTAEIYLAAGTQNLPQGRKAAKPQGTPPRYQVPYLLVCYLSPCTPYLENKYGRALLALYALFLQLIPQVVCHLPYLPFHFDGPVVIYSVTLHCL